MDYTYSDISKMIDHSLLSPTLRTCALESGCQFALDYDVASVCIMPYYVKRCSEILAGSSVAPSTTIGFPHGGHTGEVKRAEAEQALAEGCQELDMVVNISKVLSGEWGYVRSEIEMIVDLAHQAGQKVKVIFENCYLSDIQKVQLCHICGDLNADWVKTSTGFGTDGATMDDLVLMRRETPQYVQIKAAGGVRDLQTLLEVRQLGVTRVGASKTFDILSACREQLGLSPIRSAAATA